MGQKRKRGEQNRTEQNKNRMKMEIEQNRMEQSRVEIEWTVALDAQAKVTEIIHYTLHCTTK